MTGVVEVAVAGIVVVVFISIRWVGQIKDVRREEAIIGWWRNEVHAHG